MRRMWIVAVCCTVLSWGYVIKQPERYETIYLEAKKAYFKGDYGKAIEGLRMSCATIERGCDLLSHIYVGDTGHQRRIWFDPAKELEKLRQSSQEAFRYFQGFDPLEMFTRQLSLPKTDRWRLYLKLYLLKHAELNEYSAFLVVADVVYPQGKRKKIKRYATVFSLVPMGGGAMENRYVISNDISRYRYGCLLYIQCSNLDEKVDEEIFHAIKDPFVLEAAPWEKTPSIPAALVRVASYLHFNLKRSMGEYRSWEWHIDRDIPPIGHKPFLTVTVDKKSDRYKVMMGKEVEKDYILIVSFAYDDSTKEATGLTDAKYVVPKP